MSQARPTNRLARKPVRWLRESLRAGLELIYPPTCLLCRADLAESRTDDILFCRDCRGELCRPMDNRCARCGAPVGPYVNTEGGCTNCRFASFRFEKVMRLGLYEGLLRDACLKAKESWNEPLAAALAELLWQEERDQLESAEVDVVLPVPSFWVQRLVRSHNAAEVIADVLSRRLGVPTDGQTLVKTKYTRLQKRLPLTQRRNNLRGVFRVTDPNYVRGANVLLVDDILTTGTTADQAAKVLRQAGAARVFVAVVGRVLIT